MTILTLHMVMFVDMYLENVRDSLRSTETKLYTLVHSTSHLTRTSPRLGFETSLRLLAHKEGGGERSKESITRPEQTDKSGGQGRELTLKAMGQCMRSKST